MTPDTVPAAFERLMGCSDDELRRALPAALPEARLEVGATGTNLTAYFSDGTLALAWQKAPEFHIGLLRIPRLQVRFEYAGLTPDRRRLVQRRFDLATQRGGG